MSEELLELTLKIDGMKCGMCESHINDLVRRVKGVKKVNSSHSRGEAVVILSKDTSIEDIKNAITKDGYRVLNEETKPYVKKGFFASLFKK